MAMKDEKTCSCMEDPERLAAMISTLGAPIEMVARVSFETGGACPAMAARILSVVIRSLLPEDVQIETLIDDLRANMLSTQLGAKH